MMTDRSIIGKFDLKCSTALKDKIKKVYQEEVIRYGTDYSNNNRVKQKNG